jgi:hypothetical protein
VKFFYNQEPVVLPAESEVQQHQCQHCTVPHPSLQSVLRTAFVT